MMKKLVVTVAVLVVFVAYSWLFRHHNSQLVLAPKSTPTQQTSGSATAGQSSQGSNTSTGSQTGTSSSGGQTASKYKDGTYVGSIADAFYGNVQVEITISGGTISNVRFLQAPDDNPNSVNINSQAKPLLEQETIKAQSASVDTISGATDTSQAFVQSLSNALSQAS